MYNVVTAEIQQKTAEAAADNAALAQDIRRALLERLQRTVEKFPQDATEVRAQKDGKTIVYRLSDITKAYKDLTDDLQVDNTEGPVTIIWGR